MTGYFRVSLRGCVTNHQQLYLLTVDCCIVHPIGPNVQVRSLLATLKNVLVGSIINFLDLVSAKHDSINGPISMLDVVNLGSDRCYDAEVVARTLHTPPQVRGAIDCFQVSVREHNIHRLELVGDETVVTLKPPVAATEGGSQEAHTFATASH
jgi:hypothetical protein